MKHTIRFSWTTYKNHPFASFMSRSLNATGFIIALGLIIFISGISGGDHGSTIAGAIVIVLTVLYLILGIRYLSKLEDKIRDEERLQEKQRQIDEAILKYPGFDYNKEIASNLMFSRLMLYGSSVLDAYEISHGIRKFEELNILSNRLGSKTKYDR